MNTFNRAGLTLVAGASMTLVAAPAYAHPDSDHHDGVAEVGEWMPTPEEFYAPTSFQACGDTITIEGGDVRRAEDRVSLLTNGATLIEFRGQMTVDLIRESDGAVIDELDISGVGSTRISADGTKVTETLFGASILFPFSDAEAPAFQEALGTDLAYFSDPAESVIFKLKVDPETGEVVTVRSIEVDAHIVDLCQKFDGHHGDRHDEHDRHDRSKHDDHHDGERDAGRHHDHDHGH